MSPRPRRAVPLPAPAVNPSVRRVLAAKIIVTVVMWAGPALLLPPPWFPVFGIPEPPLSHLVFVRLLGAAYVALIVGYWLAWRTPSRHPGAILVGIVSNGLAALVILSVGASGGYETWSLLGKLYIWLSALAAASIAIALAMTGRSLLRKLASERSPSMKVV